MNFDLKQLESFIWVADLGSFRNAAERLNTTQPNISSRIARLETALQTTLMERDAGSVRLTASGRELLTYARSVVQRAEDLMSAANAPGLFDGVLKLGVTEIIVHTWLREFLRAIKRQYPRLMVEVIVGFSTELENALSQRAIDLTLQSEPFSRRTSGNLPLGVFPYTWVAATQCALTQADIVSIESLVEYTILTHARNTQPYAQVMEHFAQHSAQPARLVPANNLYACVDMIIDGIGIAAMPEAMIAKPVANNELARINYPWVPDSLAFFARYDAQRSSSVVRAAAEIAQQVDAAYHATTTT